MPRTVETVVYAIEELPDAAKDRARGWYRETCLEHEWYDAVFEDFEAICGILGVTLRHHPRPPLRRRDAGQGANLLSRIRQPG